MCRQLPEGCAHSHDWVQTGKDSRDNVQANMAAFFREIEDLRLQANGVLYCSTEDKRLGISGWDKDQVVSSQRRPPRLRRPVRRAGPRGLRARAADAHTASHVWCPRRAPPRRPRRAPHLDPPQRAQAPASAQARRRPPETCRRGVRALCGPPFDAWLLRAAGCCTMTKLR